VQVQVRDLQAGEVYAMNGASAVVMAVCPHPIYTGGRMALVVWWLHEERRYSFDALAWHQVLPVVLISGRNLPERERAWREAMRAGNL
jgi:hypothetical protein